MRLHRQNLDKIENEDSVTLKKLLAKEQMEVISIFRLSLDFVHATSTLPQVRSISFYLSHKTTYNFYLLSPIRAGFGVESFLI
jgi:hypothetical protein